MTPFFPKPPEECRAKAEKESYFLIVRGFLFESRVAETRSRGHSTKHQLNLDPNPENLETTDGTVAGRAAHPARWGGARGRRKV